MSDLGATASGALQGAGAGAALGPIGSAVGGVNGGLQGLFGSIGARKKKRRLRNQLSGQQARLRHQIPGVQEYFKELEQHKTGQLEKRKGQAIEQFVQGTVGTIPTLQRKIASTGLEGSGSGQKLIGSTRARLGTSVSSSLENIGMQEEDMLLSLDQQRKQQLQGIIDQIETLESKKRSM